MKTVRGSLALVRGRNAWEDSVPLRLEEAIYLWWYEVELATGETAGMRSVRTLKVLW